MIVSDYLGCSDSTGEFAFVKTNPTAIITTQSDTVCEATLIDFNATYSISYTGTINQWHWDFGDGNTSPLENTQHTYMDTCGSFTVTLSVTDSKGCTHDATYNIFINCNPNASFTWERECEGIPTPFFANPSSTPNPNFNITSWEWNFGITPGIDNLTQNPTYPYDTCGNDIFTVTLVVGDNQTPNCYSTKQETISVACNPIASFYADTVCLGDITPFYSTSTSGGTDSIWTYTWTHYGGTPASTPNAPTSQYEFYSSGITTIPS